MPETVGSVTHEPPPDASFADFEGNDQQEQESSTKTEATSAGDNDFAAEFDTAFDSFADFSKNAEETDAVQTASSNNDSFDPFAVSEPPVEPAVEETTQSNSA